MVVVAHVIEYAAKHDVPEVVRADEFGHADLEGLADAEVGGLPGDFGVFFQEASGGSGDGDFPGLGGGGLVGIDAPREVEDAFARSLDEGFEFDDGHRLRPEFRVGAEVADALGDLRKVGFPVVFVFDGDISGEAVFADLIEDGEVVDDACSEGAVVGPLGDGGAVLHVEGVDTRGDFFDDFEGIETGGGPVADIGAEADVFVAAVDGFPDGVRIPECGGFRVVVVTDLDVVFLGEFFEGVEGVEGLGGDAVEVHFFGEFEGFTGFGFVFGDAGDAEIVGDEVVFLEVVEDGLDFVVREVRAEFEVAVVAAEGLSREDFDAAEAGGCGHFDGLEEGEFLE